MSYFYSFILVCFIMFVFTRGQGQGAARYAKSVMLGLTQFFNIVTGGHPDQTFSGRCGIMREQGSWLFTLIAILLDAIFKLRGEADHCAKAIERDRPALVGYEISFRTVIQYTIMLAFVAAGGKLMGTFGVCTL